jgi:hypothetical protein
MEEALRVVFTLAGACLVAITIVDLTGTLVVTGGVTGRWRPSRLAALRGPYGAQLQSLIQYLVAPAGFWGHSAELGR